MKLCQIYNIAPHYRAAIYSLIDEAYDCDLYCSYNKTDIKSINFSLLRGRIHQLKTVSIGKAYYQFGVPLLAFKSFDAYLVTGDAWCVSTWFFLIYARIMRKSVYIWTHGLLGKESGIKRKLNLLLLRFATSVFLYGDRAKQLLLNENFNPNKLFVVHNSLDYNQQLFIRSRGIVSDIFRTHFGNEEKVLVFIGRLTKVKRLDILLDALSVLKRQGIIYNLVLVGSGGEQELLKTYSIKLNLEKQVWFYGECYQELQNAKLIYNADICVSPGNVGLTAIHSMVFGTPVISNDDFDSQMPESEAIIPGKTGAFFAKGNPLSLAEVINKWFVEHRDRDVVRRDCYTEIDNNWTPSFQFNVIKSVIGE